METKPLMDFRARAEEVAEKFRGDERGMSVYLKAIAAIDPVKIAAVQQKYAKQLADFDPDGQFKYADVPFWIAHKVSRATGLGLDARKPASILDIAVGAGHFAAVCKALGHDVCGTDLPVPFYRDVCAALGVERRVAPVMARNRLPDFGRKFDYVTSFWICFDVITHNRVPPPTYWSIADWVFLFRDLFDRQLRYPGIIHFELNPHHTSDGGEQFDRGLLEFCAHHGASVDVERGVIDFHADRPPRVFGSYVAPATATAAAPVSPAGSAVPFLICRENRVNLAALNPLNALDFYRGPAVPAMPGEDRVRGSFPIPGKADGGPPTPITFDGDWAIFPQPGEYYFYCNRGAFKCLILQAGISDRELIVAVAAFVAKNIVHSMADFWLTTNADQGWDFTAKALAQKLFASDQPLQLQCSEAALFLGVVLNKLGISVRYVAIGDPGQAADHRVLEAFDAAAGRWLMVDPDYGACVSEGAAGILSVAEILEQCRSGHRPLSVTDLAGKSWLLWEHNMPQAFFGQKTWKPEISGASPTAEPGEYIALWRKISHADYHTLHFSEDGWSLSVFPMEEAADAVSAEPAAAAAPAPTTVGPLDAVDLQPPFEHVAKLGQNCWRLALPEPLSHGDDLENQERSAWRLVEDGTPIGQAHALHRRIGEIGCGAYSHWGNVLYFSTSDNSDPNRNGRRYGLVRRAEGPDPGIAAVGASNKEDPKLAAVPAASSPPGNSAAAPTIHLGAPNSAEVERLKVVLRQRDVREIVYFHTDHFEPWGGRAEDERWRALERFARLSRHSSFGRRLSLFYTPWLVHVLVNPGNPAGYRNDGDGVAFKERSPEFVRRCVEFVRPLETEVGHEFHVHVHHEGWTRSDVKDAVAVWVRENSTPAADSRRLDFFLRLSREVMQEEIGRPVDRWAFVHGNWALNAADPQSCCIEDEMAVLLRQGCFGDFTFPAGNVRCNPSLIEYPYTCLPVSGVKSYDHPDSDPRRLSRGGRSITPDRFLIWNSPIKAAHSSLDFYDEDNRRLFRQPEALVRAWLEQSVVVDGRLYIKTHAHSLHYHYRPWNEDSHIPHTYPDLVRAFDLLAELGDAAATPITLATVSEVVDHLRRYDRDEAAPAPPSARDGAADRADLTRCRQGVGAAIAELPRIKTVLAAGMHEIAEASARTRPIDSYYASRVARDAVLETYETAFIDYALAKLPAAKFRLFEVGIGWGMLSICLAALGYRVIGFVGQHEHAEAARFLRAKAAAVAPNLDDNLIIIEGLFPDALRPEMLGSDKQNVMLSTNIVHSFTAENQQRILDSASRFDIVLIESGTFGVSRNGDAREQLRHEFEGQFNIVETVWQDRILVMKPRGFARALSGR